MAKNNNFIFEFIKFVLFLLAIPVIAAVTISFQKEILELKISQHYAFNRGLFTYALLNFFLTDLTLIYKFGQSISAELFRFWEALAKVAGYIFPIFTVVTVLGYYIVVRVLHIGVDQAWWFFAIGFTFAMHLIMTARELYETDTSLFKPNYLFEMTLVYILDIFLMVELLNATAWKFSLVGFAQTVLDLTIDFYHTAYFKFF